VSIWRRSHSQLPPGIYDEIVSDALEAKLAALKTTHAVDTHEVTRDSEVDEQLVTLVRDAARVAIGAKTSALDKIAVARSLLARSAKARPSCATSCSAGSRRWSLG